MRFWAVEYIEGLNTIWWWISLLKWLWFDPTQKLERKLAKGWTDRQCFNCIWFSSEIWNLLYGAKFGALLWLFYKVLDWGFCSGSEDHLMVNNFIKGWWTWSHIKSSVTTAQSLTVRMERCWFSWLLLAVSVSFTHHWSSMVIKPRRVGLVLSSKLKGLI